MGMIFKKISSSFVILNILHIVQCIELNETLITQRHRQRYTIDDLLHRTFESWISGDIDMDPCKSGGFLGDIALPNVNYETEWQRQKLNKTFQQEMERLKQEVYHEGLQVEEEGLTDIVRKKTKQPVMVEYTTTYDKKLNDPMLELNGNGATLKENPYQNVPDSNNDNNDIYSVEINATIIDNNDNIIIKNITNNSNDTFDSKKDTASMKKDIKNMTRNIDRNKIQSNTKDIIDDSGDNIIYNKRISIVTVTQPSVQLHRTTIPNRFSNSGGNGGSLDNVKILTADGAVETFSNHKRHRRRRQDKNHSKDKTNYEARLARLKTELSRSTLSQNDPHVKTTTITENTKNKIRRDKSKNNKNKKNKNSKIITTIPTPTVNLNFGPVEGERTHRVTRAATAKKERIWDYGVIPYEIDGNFSGLHKALFKQAMRHWENFTCIKFVERNPIEHPNYIVFTERPCGCCSFVGKRGNGPQAISIGKNCDKFGIVVHELGHVVGFWHEHTRPDRENHVVIEKNNIMSGQEYNFNKLTEEEVNSLGLPYDYDSIMHYARNTFSKGTYLDTIFPIEIPGRKRPEIGQRVRLSEGDIAQANLLYKCYKCGRTFQDNAGSFTSPSYHSPSATMEPERCEWRITATHGERIILNITDLDIYKSNNCRSDYLEIRDGYWHKSPVLGKFCGSGKVNDLIKSTGSRMLLTYITTYRQYGMRGFSASYEAVCGGEITLENEARLESPNYPLEYLPNKECIWRITVPEDYQVALKFQSFEVENHDTCMYDYVEVRDGDSPESRLIGVFCGYKVPPDMRSSSNHLFVKFVSDGSVQKAGFSATLLQEVDECEHMDHGCEQECINTLGGYECACELGYELHSDKKSCENACGGVLDSLNGTILSPSFPKEYPILKECVWEIIAPKQHKITLNFTHFDLEGNTFYQASECEYDSVTIYSKMGEGNLKRHGAFCGTKLPPPITSEGNALRVEFKSDKTVQKTGFAAVFFTDIDECAVNNGGCQHDCKNTIGSYACSCHNGFTLHPNGHDCKEGGCKYEVSVPHGQIFSPNYPDYYPPMKDCIWHFTTTPGHRIRLVFNVFDIEPHQECAYDHIVIYDGSSPESSILGRFCGAKTPHPISSTSNEMYMNFKTDSSVQRKGFFASHTTACGGHLPASHRVKHLYSHAKYGDSMYDNGVDCEWTIEADQGMNVELKFLTFEIEEENSCSYDYVEVYGGLDDSSGPLHGKYCGNNNPPEIISMNEAILIRFRSDDTVGFKGFSASYVAVSPFDEFEEESESAEITPFPGSLKNMYIKRKNIHDEDDYEEEEDHGTFSQPHPRSRIKNTVRNSIGRSSQVVD